MRAEDSPKEFSFRALVLGIIIGGLYKLCSSAFYLWNEAVSFVVKKYESALVSLDCTPALLGVGYIIGPRISMVLFTGSALVLCLHNLPAKKNLNQSILILRVDRALGW
ncbi:hypothetical protein [Candidatus Neptunochlamydia vexilliferae]|uniref:Uncharacterized protein n=1 Tax=Candidatus Neptunichlamydia vexilliferae TaxID=1651774 RepID=A0ABS0B0W2_9BACT|nr:hypothetical protein [Candidatus Neptunochlamydia vexilliferae]MBF5060029.1 hypothetical protein [Candidatus Neptunochlamydia vexilliferae]